MKRLISIIALAIVLLAAPTVYAAGSCTQTDTVYLSGGVVVKLACNGDASNGSIPNIAIDMSNISLGQHYLYMVRAYPTSGGTAPDAADVFILDAAGEDYLGSADGGTTANKGANLIHATLVKSTMPYSYNASSWFFFPVVSGLTLKVASQGTASANYTIELVFVR